MKFALISIENNDAINKEKTVSAQRSADGHNIILEY